MKKQTIRSIQGNIYYHSVHATNKEGSHEWIDDRVRMAKTDNTKTSQTGNMVWCAMCASNAFSQSPAEARPGVPAFFATLLADVGGLAPVAVAVSG